jgi:RimJ/RimL family protein N-acetyltransferase
MTTSTRVQLVALDRRHLPATLTWMNDPALMRLLGRARVVRPEEHQRWFEALSGRRDCQYFAIETTQGTRHLGNVWLWDIDYQHRRAEVRVLIGEPGGSNKGVGTEAIKLVTDHAFGVLNLHRVYAYVLAFNPRARRAFEKAGFQPEGLLRSDRVSGDTFVDVHLLGRLKEDPV